MTPSESLGRFWHGATWSLSICRGMTQVCVLNASAFFFFQDIVFEIGITGSDMSACAHFGVCEKRPVWIVCCQSIQSR